MNTWKEILNYLKSRVNTQSYQTWLRPTYSLRQEGKTLWVRVPNHDFERWLREEYGELVREALDHLDLGAIDIRYCSDESGPSAASSGNNGGHSMQQHTLDFTAVDHELNPKYTFDSFVVGASNQFAHAAALAVAEAPSKAYNPLFLYGGVGLGKTHLMQAVGHVIKKQRRETCLAYVSSEKFTNEVINSLRFDRMVSFRDKYRTVDTLLIDDIQFLAGKERTQEEFFHTFNALYEAQKQIVISSDCPPKAIEGLEGRLKSRFAWGLTADIQPPDLETKVAILMKKAEDQKVRLPDEVALFIAGKIKSSVRDLEGGLTRLLAYASLTGAEITVPMCQQVLRHIIDLEERRVTIEQVQRAVCQEFNLTLAELKGKSHSRAIAYPRQIAMFLSKEMTSASLPQIGREFGGKHHTTVLHSVNKVQSQRHENRDLNKVINKLSDSLN